MSFGTVQAEKMTTESGYSLGAGNASSFKNRLINGAMTIDQRNAGASVTPSAVGSLVYTLDRWSYYGEQASKFAIQQDAGAVTPPVGFNDYLGATSTSAYSPVSTDQFIIRQNIEGFNIADLGWGTANAKSITLSFWARSSLTGTFAGNVCNFNGTRSYVFSYTINSANTWEYETITIPGDTSGTWSTTNGIGLSLSFALGTGSSYQSAAGVWNNNYRLAPAGAVNVVATNGATFYITGVQFEVGTVATSFDFRDYGRELILCQRYFEKTWQGGATPTTNSGLVKFAGNVFNFNGTSYCGTFSWKVQKRAIPTIRVWSNSPQFTLGSWTGYTSSTGTDVVASVIDDSTTVVNLSFATSTYTFVQGHIEGSSEL